MITTNVQCDECQATCIIEHQLDDDVYKVVSCPFCSGSDIHTDTEME